MRKATRRHTTIHLSDLTADPVLKDFFRRGGDFTVPAYPVLRPVRPLDGLVRAEIPVPAYA